MPHIQDQNGKAAPVIRAYCASAARAGVAITFGLVILGQIPVVYAAPAAEKVCDNYLRQLQTLIRPVSLAPIHAACLQRAAQSEMRILEHVFDTCIQGGRDADVLSACLSDTLTDDERFEEFSAGYRELEIAALAVTQREQLVSPRLAAQPASVESLLDELLSGDALEIVSVRGIRPGLDYEQAEDIVRRQWDYAGLGAGQFRPANPARFATAERDGGMVHFDVLDGQVGQIKFTERYKVLLDTNSARERLISRYGKPDKEQGTRIGWVMAWSNYPMRLQVKVVNESGGVPGYQGTIELALWSREYETWLVARQQRCEELRQLATAQISVSDKQALGKDCTL